MSLSHKAIGAQYVEALSSWLGKVHISFIKSLTVGMDCLAQPVTFSISLMLVMLWREDRISVVLGAFYLGLVMQLAFCSLLSTHPFRMSLCFYFFILRWAFKRCRSGLPQTLSVASWVLGCAITTITFYVWQRSGSVARPALNSQQSSTACL